MDGKADPTITDTDATDNNEASRGRTTGDRIERTVGRRTYLKLGATAAAAAAAGVFTSGASADDGDYDVITIPRNSHEDINLSGETFENVLIDVTNPGASVRIVARNSTIRNVGIRGEQGPNVPGNSWMVVRATAGNTMRLENVYMGDGLEANHGGGGVLVHPNHAGECIFDRVHVAGSGDNGLYGSAPGEPTGNGGRVEMRNCLSYNNTVSQFRIGTPGSSIQNCVGWVDETTPGYRRSGGSSFSRGVWHWYARNCEVIDVDIAMNGYGPAVRAGREGGHLVVRDSEINGGNVEVDPSANTRGNLTTDNVGSDPTLEPPAGVPMTAEEAAAGQGYDGDGSELPNEIVIEGEEGDEEAEYWFAVDGEVEPSEENGATIDDDTTIDDGIVNGMVTTDSDAFRFSGEITAFEVDGPVTVYLDGEAACLSSLERLDNELDENEQRSHMTLHNVSDEPYEFEFAVTGDVIKSDDYDSPIDPTDCIHEDGDQTLVTGDVGGGSKKTFYFTGIIESFAHNASDNEARLWVNGEEHDEASMAGVGYALENEGEGEQEGGDNSGNEDNDDNSDNEDGNEGSDGNENEDDEENTELDSTIVIEGVPRDVSHFTFEVSGEVEADDERSTGSRSSTIDGNEVEGYVRNENVFAYRFSGDLVAFRLQGGAIVRLEG